MRPKTKLFAVKFRRISKFFCQQVLQKKFGCIFPSYASKNEAVCCEVQKHFRSFRLSSFIKEVVGAFSDLCVQK